MIIDELKYLLSLDPGDYIAGARRADEETTRLTNSIDKKLAASLSNIDRIIKGMGWGKYNIPIIDASKNTTELAKSTSDANKAAEKFSDTNKDKLAPSIKDLIKLYAIWRGFNMALDFNRTSAQAERLAYSFRSISENLGYDGQKLLAELRTMTRGTISEIGLMTQVSRASLMGISDKDIPQLMKISQAAAKVFNQSTATIFETLTSGIARGNSKALGSIGIIVDETYLYRDASRELGRELTENERKQYLLNEAIRQGDDIIKRVGESATDTVDAIDKLSASWTNFKTSIESSGKPFEVIANLLDIIASHIKFTNEAIKDDEGFGLLTRQIAGLALHIAIIKERGLGSIFSKEFWMALSEEEEKFSIKITDTGKQYDLHLASRLQFMAEILDANKRNLELIEKQNTAIGDQANRYRDLYNVIKKSWELQYPQNQYNQVFVAPLPTPQYNYLLPPPEMQRTVITAWQSFWEDMEFYLGRGGSDALMGAFQRISQEFDRGLGNMVNAAQSLLSGDLAGAANAFTDLIFNAIGSTDNLTENMQRWQEQTERNIEAIQRMNDVERQIRIEELQRLISLSNSMREIWGVSDEQMDARIRYAQEELNALYGNIADDRAIRGIESFQELLDYFLGADDLTFDQGRRLIDYFTTMFDLTTEQQIQLYTMLGNLITQANGWTTESWMQFNEILNGLNETLNNIESSPFQTTDRGTRESQIYRSITTITESQANLMQATLNSIHLDLQGIGSLVAQITAAITGSYQQIFNRGIGGSPIYIGSINSPASSVHSLLADIRGEMRSRGAVR